MEDLLIDRDLWIVISRTKPTGMKDEVWVVLERNARRLIRLCLVDLQTNEIKNKISKGKPFHEKKPTLSSMLNVLFNN